MTDYDVLDIKDWQQEGDDLKAAIYEAVKKTQVPIMLPLPNQLVMTAKQFDMLKSDDDMSGAWSTKEQIWRTDYNCMDIIVL